MSLHMALLLGDVNGGVDLLPTINYNTRFRVEWRSKNAGRYCARPCSLLGVCDVASEFHSVP